MRATPLARHSPRALRELLRTRGWEPGPAATSATGLDAVAVLLEELPGALLEALLPQAARLGLDLVTGEDWALLAGTRARLSAFARPWLLPPELAEAAIAVGLALPAELPEHWVTARGTVPLDRPVIVGILNVTPDSFSDGGLAHGVDAALRRAEHLVAQGAGMLDVGGESTRPGRTAVVPEAEERARVVPVLAALATRFPALPLSVDTFKAGTARAALDAGAWAVNDVSAGRLDPALPPVAARAGAGLVLMHSRGAALGLASYDDATYAGDAPAGAVLAELRAALDAAVGAGVAPEAIVVDPGFGFGKTAPQSTALLDELGALRALGRPLLVGVSRKRFLGELTGRPVEERETATAVACAAAYARGARLFRVHAPGATRDALAIAEALA